MLGTGCASSAAAETPSDNVVIIHVDDLGWRDLGCMGSPVYETPHIDALAESGTRYTNAYAAGSLSPSLVHYRAWGTAAYLFQHLAATHF